MRALIAVLALAGCGGRAEHRPSEYPDKLVADVKGAAVHGEIHLHPQRDGLLVETYLADVPAGTIGLAFHEYGECGVDGGKVGRAIDPRAGDLVSFDAAGGDLRDSQVVKWDGIPPADRLEGRSLVVHADGKEGGELACGTIAVGAPEEGGRVSSR